MITKLYMMKKTISQKNNGYGGARAGAGRKKKPSRVSCPFRMDKDVFEGIKREAAKREMIAGDFVTELFSDYRERQN